MSGARELLGKIVALRQRLEQVQGLAREASSAAVSIMQKHGTGLSQLWTLEQQVDQNQEQGRALEAATKPALPPQQSTSEMPKELTARARRVLQKGRELILALRELDQEPALKEAGSPKARYYHQTLHLTETTLRMAQLLPDSVSGQLQICDGMEVVLSAVEHRLEKIRAMSQKQQKSAARIQQLAQWLMQLEAGELKQLQPFAELADQILLEASQCTPLEIYHPVNTNAPDRAWVADCVARHALVTAQVMARIARHNPDLKVRLPQMVVAALIHDVGMLRLSPELVAKAEAFDDNDKREVELHTQHGEDIIRHALPEESWLVEAARSHHERLNGTAYPDGLRDQQVSQMTRILGVCDVYAACCATRPHRDAHETRTALTTSLMLAEQGMLDRQLAELLLHLSFYPPGTLIEMADGSVGAVIATHNGWESLQAPARPVVALLTDSSRKCLPTPLHVDLSQCDSRSIVRAMPHAEVLQILGERYPEWL